MTGNISPSDIRDLLSIPLQILELAEEVRDFRLQHRRILSIQDKNLLVATEARLRGQSTAIGALISESILKDVEPQLKELRDAVSEMDRLLDDIQNLRAILLGFANLLQLTANVITLITPTIPPLPTA